MISTLVLLASTCAPLAPPPRAARADCRDSAAAEHGPDFWRSIVAAQYALPSGESAYDLILELSELLGSPDPELRDDFGYGICAAWIWQQRLLTPDELRRLAHLWRLNLEEGIGETSDNGVLLRSFSALDLSLLVALDNQSPVFEADDFRQLLDAALTYLESEADLRGWIAGLGWLHSTAHTADLLKHLARSRHLTREDQTTMLLAIADKLEHTHGLVYAFGEDERLAAAVLSLLAREDFEPEAFSAFLQQMAELRVSREFDPELFAARQNHKNLLRALHVRLALAQELTPVQLELHETLLLALARM